MTDAKRPKPTVAVIGASTDRNKYGNRSVRAHAEQGYHVYPVNPHEQDVEGWPCFATMADLPVAQIERVTMYVPPRVGLKLLEEIAAKHPLEFWLNPGTASPDLLARAEELGLPVIQACSIVDVWRRPQVAD